MKLISSIDRTIRTYLLPNFESHLLLVGHRAAVNAIALSSTQIISASGDRSVRIWDVDTGALLHLLEAHHERGIASVDYRHPFILTGSSDHHIRLLDTEEIGGLHKWTTSTSLPNGFSSPRCETCGRSEVDQGEDSIVNRLGLGAHRGLVRSVALGKLWALTASYDQTIKVWDKETGTLLADLTGAHSGRIFCVSSSDTKVRNVLIGLYYC